MTEPPEKNFINTYAYLGNNKALTITADRLKIFLDTRELESLSIVTNGVYEEAVEWAIRKNIKKDNKVIDVGANIGYFTLISALNTGINGKVFSFEPNPYVFSLLRSSVILNGFQNRVKLFQKAASHKRETRKFTWTDSGHGGGHLTYPENEDGIGHNVETQTVTLDESIPKEFLPIDLIKIDVEGSEPYVVKGAKKILNSSPEIKIVMEWDIAFMKKRGCVVEDFIELLKSYDFSIHRIQRVGWREGKTTKIGFEDLPNIDHCNLLFAKPIGDQKF